MTNPFGAGSGGYGSRASSTINGGFQQGDSWTPNVVIKQKQAGVKRRLAIFVLEDSEPMLWGSEPIYRDGQPIGYTTSGFYGHSVGGAIAMGYVSNASGVSAKFIESGSYEINISGRRYPAKAHLRAPYDPERKKLLS